MIPKETAPNEFLQNPSEFEDTLCTTMIRRWYANSFFPMGEYTGKLGQIGKLPVESAALLIQSGITWDTFSDEILDALPREVRPF